MDTWQDHSYHMISGHAHPPQQGVDESCGAGQLVATLLHLQLKQLALLTKSNQLQT